MAICITRWEMMKNEDGSYKIAKYKNVKKYPNDYFDDKLDIFSESDWKKFIINYQGQGESRLSKYSSDGTLLCWSISNIGTTRIVRDFFGNNMQGIAHLFPQVKNFKDENLKKLVSYNVKHIYPHIPER